MQFAVIDSSTEIQEDKVAKNSSYEKQDSYEGTIEAFPIAENTFWQGNKHQAWSGTHSLSAGKTYTAGMIMAPARKATPVSKKFQSD